MQYITHHIDGIDVSTLLSHVSLPLQHPPIQPIESERGVSEPSSPRNDPASWNRPTIRCWLSFGYPIANRAKTDRPRRYLRTWKRAFQPQGLSTVPKDPHQKSLRRMGFPPTLFSFVPSYQILNLKLYRNVKLKGKIHLKLVVYYPRVLVPRIPSTYTPDVIR